jgi:2-methylisocitrate lyase-like PEP mutase family enzyme
MTDSTTADQQSKSRAFHALHAAGTFVLPNFWDVGSAVLLQNLGFKALASTSAGFAQSLGRLDSQVTLDEKLKHLQEVASATVIPINADFEHGFADAPDACARNLVRAIETGIAGASIEDWSRHELYDATLATERIQACAEAAHAIDPSFVLTARAENLLRGVGNFDDTLARLATYDNAGADALYAPGLANEQQISDVLGITNKPINVLCPFLPNTTVQDYERLGVRRISLGSALANVVTQAAIDASQKMLSKGDFSWVSQGASGKAIQQLLS